MNVPVNYVNRSTHAAFIHSVHIWVNMGKWKYFCISRATVYIVIWTFLCRIELSVYLANGTNFSIMRPMMLMNKALGNVRESGNRGIRESECIKRATHTRYARYTFNYLILIKILILPAACMQNRCILSGSGHFKWVRGVVLATSFANRSLWCMNML